jgi:hypothetical protein
MLLLNKRAVTWFMNPSGRYLKSVFKKEVKQGEEEPEIMGPWLERTHSQISLGL